MMRRSREVPIDVEGRRQDCAEYQQWDLWHSGKEDGDESARRPSQGTLVADRGDMRSVVDLEIAAPRERVAELYADPDNNPKWMEDLERNEPISGKLGEPGSRYRMVSKDSDMHFVVTVVSVRLPENVQLHLDWKQSTVDINVDFRQQDVGTTRFVSTEDFNFTGLLPRIFGRLATRAIKSAHRRHMEAFKRFAERSAPQP
jgi:uncharacterized protein YndB with AHSA1/START domain